ncbi:MAG TPA: BMP family ABC transporter substrate-binding protein [Xanthobacteraceae bacterium]|nr:BMP family ABC transporter substrate-binding protein [Xanthobacteraceae bacterium]
MARKLFFLGLILGALTAFFAAAPLSAQQKPPLVVGAIFVGSVNDYGYNRSMKDGLDEMAHAIPGLKLLEAENVPETAESERIMEGMIQQGAKLIFATSFGHQQFAFNLAKTHPDVYFEHAGGWMMSHNFGNFFGATQSAWYPMGVAAGKMTKSNTLGFVVGVPIGYAIGNVNAFEMGARSVNPKAVTRVVVTGGWSDKAKEAAATNALIDQGADVVTMHVDSPATIIQTAESRGVYSIGFQSITAAQLAPKGWITGLGFTWGPFMTGIAKSVIAGTFKPAFVREGLGQMMAIAPFGAAVPPDVRTLVMASADQVEKGFNPFTGPVTDNTGAVRIPAGQSWGGDKMGNFDWYVDGVIGKAK